VSTIVEVPGGDYGCHVDECALYPHWVVLCPDCGARFACTIEHAREIDADERKKKHLRRSKRCRLSEASWNR
jgi:hypothetical protein